ncbi:ferritin-like domain-containing protein [Aquihabitans daechungensis]|uniref:ferritin-like domain-containing protein n=1 Tax=Aquihabitans daechungensis TaxID=1052257 RepID=UPI003BA089E4
MQTDQSIDSATATSRRTFLTRTAVGGALVTAGALALPLGSLVPVAGARAADQGDLGDEDFAAFAMAIELAAVAAYTAAFDKDVLDAEWSDRILQFQSHHQDVADTLIELGDESAAAPVAEAAFAKRSVDAVTAASDQQGVLAALAVVEGTLAATHLAGVGRLAEKTTARTVTQVLAVEGQQAALLAVASGTPVAEATPATSSGDAALTIPEAGSDTTTTTAPAGTSTDDSQTDDSTPETADDTQTSAPSAND